MINLKQGCACTTHFLTMTHEKEARRIVQQFEDAIYQNINTNGTREDEMRVAKQCALIHVSGIISSLEEYDKRTEADLKQHLNIDYCPWELQNMDGDFRYWTKVKQAIEELK